MDDLLRLVVDSGMKLVVFVVMDTEVLVNLIKVSLDLLDVDIDFWLDFVLVEQLNVAVASAAAGSNGKFKNSVCLLEVTDA